MRLFELLKEYGLGFKGKDGKKLKAEVHKLIPGIKTLNAVTPEQEQILRNFFTTLTQEPTEAAESEGVPNAELIRDEIGAADNTVVDHKRPDRNYRWCSKAEMYGNRAMGLTQMGVRASQGYTPVSITGPEKPKVGIQVGDHWELEGKILMSCPMEMRVQRVQEQRRRQAHMERTSKQALEEVRRHMDRRSDVGVNLSRQEVRGQRPPEYQRRVWSVPGEVKKG